MTDGGERAESDIPVSGGDVDQSSAVAPTPPRRRRRRVAIMTVLAVFLVGALLLDLDYLLTKKPLTELIPPAIGLAKTLPPTYVTSYYGVTSPVGVAVSPDAQRIYVAEGEGDRLIRAFDRTGQELFNFSPPNSTVFGRAPVYMATDAKGQLYVADRQLHHVSIYDRDGHFVSDIQPPDNAQFAAPMGVAFDHSGNLLITDATQNDHTLVVLDPNGKLVRRIGKSGDGPGEFTFPNQAAADSRGRIYVTDGNDSRVEYFTPDGQFIGELGTGSGTGAIGMPRGIAADNQDRLYVVDTIGCNVLVYDVSGDNPSYLFSFGTEGFGDGQMRYPSAVAVDATGRVYVTDRINQRLEVWSY